MPTSDPPKPPATIPSSHPLGSNNPKSPSAIALSRITKNMVELSKSARTFEQEYPGDIEHLVSTFGKFYDGLRKHHPDLLPPPPTPNSSDLLAELNHLSEALTMMQTTVARLESQINAAAPITMACQSTAHLTSASKPTSPMPAPPTPPATHHSALKPSHRPSIIAHTATKDPANHTPPHILCNTINESLKQSSHLRIHISSAKWTTKGNLILTGGHANTLRELLSARSKISETITSNFPRIHEHSTPLRIEANIRWSKVRINNVPTGVSSDRGPWTPDECHEALIADNSGYKRLNVTQRPSWVKHPSTYVENTTSSLVFAFEDHDGHLAREMTTSNCLYIFGMRTTVKPWVDRHTPILAPIPLAKSPKIESSASPSTPPTPKLDPSPQISDTASSPEQVAIMLDETVSSKQQDPDWDCIELLQRLLEEEERATRQVATQSHRKTRARQTNSPKPSKTRNPKAEPPPGPASAFQNPATHPTIRQASRGRIKA